MLYNETFSRYLRFIIDIPEPSEINEELDSFNLRRTYLITCILSLGVRKLTQKWSTAHRFRDNDNFRKWPESSGNLRKILNSYDRRIDSF